jgi:hypothetical protein
MPSYPNRVMEAVRGMMDAVRGEGIPLRPQLLLTKDFEQDDDEIAFLDADGRRHCVTVQVGRDYVGVNTHHYETIDLGDGMVLSRFAEAAHATPRSKPGPAFRDDLRAAFAAAPDAFEPVRGPGIGSHSRLPDLLAIARAAIAGTDAAIALNAGPGIRADEDTLTFAGSDGEALPVHARTRPGGYEIVDAASGEVLSRFGAETGGGAAEAALREALPASPVPGI